MKKIYLLFLLAIAFSFNQINAQEEPCPASGIAINDSTIVFSHESTTPDCSNLPLEITVNGSIFELELPCSEPTSVYNLKSGEPVLDPTNPFTVNPGFDSPCVYGDGVLPIEDFEFLNSTFRIFPNPLMDDSQLTVKFGANITAKIYIYDVTGKLAVTDEIDNVNSKRINTSTLTNGIYFLRLVTDNVTITKKVIIMK